MASFYQPLIGDDFSLKFAVQEENSLIIYLHNYYVGWSGRFLQSFLSFYIFKYETLLIFLKLFNIPAFIISIWLGWFCITGEYIYINSKNYWKFLSFLILIWISISSVSENIIWVAGSITSLYPLFFSLIFLSTIFNYHYFHKDKNQTQKYISIKSIILIILGFLSGSSNEQISCIVFIISTILIIKIRNENNKKIPLEIYLGFFALVVGIIFLLSAPGNYIRMGIAEDSFISMIYKYIIYLLGAYYSLGSETAGKTFFLSLIVITFIFNNELNFTQKKFKYYFVWVLSSVMSLIIMLPVSNFLSSRTTFFAILFFYFFWLGLNYSKENEIIETQKIKKTAVLFILSSLLFVDSFIGYMTNQSLFQESSERYELIQKAKLNNNLEVKIPFFATIPSRLTYMHNPKHDREFLNAVSDKFDIEIFYINDKKSKLPHTKNILKEIKNILN
tara:strand:+ start:125 stop:1465 length:1341 start_codon:yes stop_codon:yes gene_type:complete